jgi:hypothetical protein
VAVAEALIFVPYYMRQLNVAHASLGGGTSGKRLVHRADPQASSTQVTSALAGSPAGLEPHSANLAVQDSSGGLSSAAARTSVGRLTRRVAS